MNHPYVIILILSYNGKHLLKDSISSYITNGYPNFEGVVIDNGSIDGTKECVEKNTWKHLYYELKKIWAIQGTFILGWIKHFQVSEKSWTENEYNNCF
jgi:hypothetical protein